MLAFALILPAVCLLAQEPGSAPPDSIPTLSLKTSIVAVPAVVRDRNGKPVKGLTRDDFVLRQDGKEQPIRYFSQDSELPLTLCLMVDTSGSQRTFIADETKASRIFFRAMLQRPEDRAMLVQFDENVLALQGMTNSVEKLQTALKRLSEPHASLIQGAGGGTLLFDAIWGTAEGTLRKETGRRAMILLTDGGDNGSGVELRQAIAAAQRADVVVYSINYSAIGGFVGFYNPGLDTLARISRETGGEVFEVGNGLTLEQIFARIAEDLRLQYQIGYVAPPAKRESFHKIDLRMKDRKFKVESRKGFYSRE